MADISTTEKMIDLVDHYDLSGRSFIHQFTTDQLARDYNGIGPEWFPDRLRKAIDRLNENLQPAAFVHDVRWSHSSGDGLDFYATNEELVRNGCTIAMAKYAWYDPRRYLLIRQAVRFGNLCHVFGWPAYKASHKHNKENQHE